MSPTDSKKDYYEILGVDLNVSRIDLDRQYKRAAAIHHPDLGGNEERMKSLNEAYSVLKDEALRQAYDQSRQQRSPSSNFVPVSSPSAQDVGLFGSGLSALLCLIAGGFLLLLVRFQGAWFLWPLAILAIFVIGFGVMMARSAMLAARSLLPVSNLLRRHAGIQEVAFWIVVGGGIYGLYLVLTQ